MICFRIDTMGVISNALYAASVYRNLISIFRVDDFIASIWVIGEEIDSYSMHIMQAKNKYNINERFNMMQKDLEVNWQQ